MQLSIRRLPFLDQLARLTSGGGVEFWLRHLDPLFAVRRVWARVAAVRADTPRVRTLILEPNGNWLGFRAGQHVLVTVEIDGRRLTRAFSLSGAEDDPAPSVTVGRRPAGRVSGWLHEQARPGTVVELSQARGEFLLPADRRLPLLMVAGGTGITPFLAMLRTLGTRRDARDVVLLYWVPRLADLVAAGELRSLAERLPGLRVRVGCTREPGGGDLDGRFSAALLERVVPDFRQRLAYACGPPDLMDAVEEHWRYCGVSDRLRREWFGSPRRTTAPAAPVEVACERSGRHVRVDGVRSLLEELEAAGLHPRHGCRAGICRQCTCVKASGAVEDLRTGRISEERDEAIQLCLTRARGDVALAL
jgi:ferredoxin-NADP reductase